jgi:hypothetical protein
VARLVPLFEFNLLIIHSNVSLNISITLGFGPNNIINVVHIMGFQTLSFADLHTVVSLEQPSFASGGWTLRPTSSWLAQT